ncbi:DUF4126 domain-containing protein [Brevundimonas sp. DC300-4]|uniref:DUF4126 domain-containing protein n=1 Tax=Brevundimonas sp. DC300-4 TaxID=2804594 RepID=UPI003CFB069F
MTLYLLAFAIGVVAGLRAMTAPAAIAWAAWLGIVPLVGTPLAFLGHIAAPIILTLAAIAELITDQLPKTPSRKLPIQFITRILMGGLGGAAIGIAGGSLVGGLVAGVVGAVIGTYGGAEARARLATAFDRDLPAALIEDVVAVSGAVLIIALI